jgi:hypothetical protein
VCADPVVEVVVDGAQVQVDGFEGPEVAFDAGEVFVGADDGGGVELVGGLLRVFRTAVFASIYAARCEFR